MKVRGRAPSKEAAAVLQRIKDAEEFLALRLPMLRKSVEMALAIPGNTFSREELEMWYGLDVVRKHLNQVERATDLRIVLYYLNRACDHLHAQEVSRIPGSAMTVTQRAAIGKTWQEQQRVFREKQLAAAHSAHEMWRKWQAEESRKNPAFSERSKSDQARLLKRAHNISESVDTIRKRLS